MIQFYTSPFMTPSVLEATAVREPFVQPWSPFVESKKKQVEYHGLWYRAIKLLELLWDSAGIFESKCLQGLLK